MTIGGEQRGGGGDEIAVVRPHKRAHVLGVLRNANDAMLALLLTPPRRRHLGGEP
jgi:1-pyrroline-5-carboxylate dehydrogenase